MIASKIVRRIVGTAILCGIFAWPSARAQTPPGNGVPDSADASWQRIEELQKTLHADAPKGVNEVEFYDPIESDLHKQATDFTIRYPHDPRIWEAYVAMFKTQHFPAEPSPRRAIFKNEEFFLEHLLKAPDASPKAKQDAERTVLRQHLDHLDLITAPEAAAALEARVADYLQRFPDDPKAPNMQVRRIDLWQRVDPARAAVLRDEMAASANEKIAAAARGRQAQNALGAAPLDWKLPALDGATIDFGALRGKVVLVEFWASWCPDCAREMPTVLKTYRQFHENGLEIVGVSLDKDKEALLATTRKKGIAWPQFYDGRGWDNEVAVRYGVRGIPEVWLVNTEGKVVATGVQVDQLAALIPPLLPAR